VLALSLLAGCGPVDVPVVIVADGGSFMPPRGPPCANSGECMAGQLCEKSACGVALGRCILRPAFCDGDSRPECGCDGVTYWNDCLRRAAGVEAIEERGPCSAPRSCSANTPCPEGATCAWLVPPDQCGLVAAGACYAIPSVCTGFMPDHFYSCGGNTTQCLDACAAIRSGQPARRLIGPCP
jgi:hypothetical protein